MKIYRISNNEYKEPWEMTQNDSGRIYRLSLYWFY